MVSSATPTAISSEVPPKPMPSAVKLPRMFGRVAITARKIAPAKVILVITLLKYSTVDFPGRIPGINPPFAFMLSATSTGLKVIAV